MPPHKIGAIGRSNGKEVRMFFPSQASMVECLTMNEQGATEIMALDELLNQYANEIDDNAVTIKNTSILIDATATYKSGAFTLTTSQQIPFGRYILRFIAPENYHTGDVLQIGGKDFEVVTVSAPDTPAPDGIFAKGALVTLDVDGDSAKAFLRVAREGVITGLFLLTVCLSRRLPKEVLRFGLI